MRGYSRTANRWYEMRPTRRMTSESTVAKTGRLMHSSGRVMRLGPGSRRVDVAALERGGASRGNGRCPRLDRGAARLPRRVLRRLAANDADGAAVADLELAGGHDHVARLEPGDDLDLAVAALTRLDLHARGLVVDDLEHVLLGALRHERLLGHDDRIHL